MFPYVSGSLKIVHLYENDKPALCSKGRTIRKVMGGGGGGFSACTIFFFFRPLLVQEFFLQVKPSARIFFFFQTNIALFVVY